MPCFNISIDSGATLVFSGGGVLSAGGSNPGASMWLSSGASVTLGTTMSADPNAAYSEFITEKRNALISGGTATLNGETQIFTAGYAGLSSSCLMSLQGVRPESGNLNIIPTKGFWAEQTETTTSGGETTLRTIPPCITCKDYNNLFAFEMVLYHALNKLAWDTMVTIDATGLYPEGLWPRYQGLVTAWNFYAYKSQYICTLTAVRDTLDIVVGWANPACDTTGFTCLTEVTRTVTATPSDLEHLLIFYAGTLVTASDRRDNNTYTPGAAIGFIYKAGTSAGQLFCGKATKAQLISALDVVANSSGSAVYGSATYADISSATQISDVQDFATAGGSSWVVGVVNAATKGNDYAVQQFSLGVPSEILDAHYGGVTADSLDTYEINPRWWTRNANGVITGAVELGGYPTTLSTYSLSSRSTT